MSDHPDYEALAEAADNDRKARRERGEQVGPVFVVAPEETRCGSEWGGRYTGLKYRCILADGHTGGHHYQGASQ